MENVTRVVERDLYFIKVGEMYVSNYKMNTSFSLAMTFGKADKIEGEIITKVDGREVSREVRTELAEQIVRKMANDVSNMLKIDGIDASVKIGKQVVTSTNETVYTMDIDGNDENNDDNANGDNDDIIEEDNEKDNEDNEVGETEEDYKDPETDGDGNSDIDKGEDDTDEVEGTDVDDENGVVG